MAIARETAALGNADAMKLAAWSYATSKSAHLRNGSEAVKFAEKAVAATQRSEANFLDTLAAACAASGKFDEAISAQKEGVSLAPTENKNADLMSRLKLYETGKPCPEE